MRLKYVSFGATSAILTSMALIVGLGTGTGGKVALITALLVIAVADNISDSLGIHIHEEAAQDEEKPRYVSVSNYVTRLVVSATFIGLVLAFPQLVAQVLAVVWGTALIVALTYFIARERGQRPLREILRHLAIAALVLASSQALGLVIHRLA
jgi:hypothetical protein